MTTRSPSKRWPSSISWPWHMRRKNSRPPATRSSSRRKPSSPSPTRAATGDPRDARPSAQHPPLPTPRSPASIDGATARPDERPRVSPHAQGSSPSHRATDHGPCGHPQTQPVRSAHARGTLPLEPLPDSRETTPPDHQALPTLRGLHLVSALCLSQRQRPPSLCLNGATVCRTSADPDQQTGGPDPVRQTASVSLLVLLGCS